MVRIFAGLLGLAVVAASVNAGAVDPPRVTVTMIPMAGDSPGAAIVPDSTEGDAPSFNYFGSHSIHIDNPYLIGHSARAADGHIYTPMVCDDLHYTVDGFPDSFTHYIVNATRVDTFNANLLAALRNSPITRATPVGIGFNLAFFDAAGTNGGPGHLLYHWGHIYFPVDVPTPAAYSFSMSWTAYSPPLFSLRPDTSPMIWGCVFFDNLGDPRLDETYMDNLGVLVDNNTDEPRAGTSDDLFFTTDVAQSSTCPGDAPSGHVSDSGDVGWSQPLNMNMLVGFEQWDSDTLWTDAFDVPVCGWPYFIGIR